MMSGSIFDSKFHRDSLLALMLWKLTIIIRILLLLNICLSALFEAVGDDRMCWGGFTVPGSDSEARE